MNNFKDNKSKARSYYLALQQLKKACNKDRKNKTKNLCNWKKQYGQDK